MRRIALLCTCLTVTMFSSIHQVGAVDASSNLQAKGPLASRCITEASGQMPADQLLHIALNISRTPFNKGDKPEHLIFNITTIDGAATHVSSETMLNYLLVSKDLPDVAHASVETAVEGITINLRAHRATEGVVALKISLTDKKIERIGAESEGTDSMITTAPPVIRTIAEERDRWLSVKLGCPTQMTIGQDQLTVSINPITDNRG